MSFTTITDDELIGMGVTGLDDTPELSTEAMQAQFDEYPQFLKDKFKTHITEEEANTAAGNIGAVIPDELDNVEDEHIQPILDELAARAKSLKDWQDNADTDFHPAVLETDVFYADGEKVIVPTVDTNDVSDKAASTEFVDAKMQAIGAGDMAKSTYDPNNRGEVETAYKVDDSIVEAITEDETDYPLPEDGDSMKVMIGKIIKNLNDLKAACDLSELGYGTCTTSASTAAKVITISEDFSLEIGSIIAVAFSNTNTAQNPTFNVNNTGAKSVKFDDTVITNTNIDYAGIASKTMMYIYDGTNWVFATTLGAADIALNMVRDTAAFPSGDAYSSSQSYKVGDHVIYNNKLYKCTTACSAASWAVNSSCFTKTSLTKTVTTLNSDLGTKAEKFFYIVDTINTTTDENGNAILGLHTHYVPVAFKGDSGSQDGVYTLFYSVPTNRWYCHIANFSGVAAASVPCKGTVYYIDINKDI